MLFLFLFLSYFQIAASQNASTVLEKSIAYHDPASQWGQGPMYLKLESQNPKGVSSLREAWIDIPAESFRMRATRGQTVSEQSMLKSACSFQLHGSSEIPQDSLDKYRLTCERTLMFRDYLTYLNGLPMKLTDPGTILDPEVKELTYMGQDVLAITVRYEPEVGDEIYDFYFDPETYALRGYRFYRDERSPKGEYILLAKETMVGKMRIPRERAWYTFPDTSYLGKDILLEGKFE